jgi:hypothetical protein
MEIREDRSALEKKALLEAVHSAPVSLRYTEARPHPETL